MYGTSSVIACENSDSCDGVWHCVIALTACDITDTETPPPHDCSPPRQQRASGSDWTP